MKIRHAEEKDLKRMLEIYVYARDFMAKHGNPKQWGATNWPPENLIKEDIKAGKSYVCVNDSETVIGTFFYDYGEAIEPTYNKIEDGQWYGGNKYGVVHRIASDGSQKGVGTFCINWAYEQCGHLRIDTHNDNTVMQNLLIKSGFQKCGIIHIIEDNDPRIAFEKGQ